MFICNFSKMHVVLVWIFGLIAIAFAGCHTTKSIVYGTGRLSKNYVRLNDTLYACQTELTNGEYKDFLFAIQNSDSALFRSCMVDTNAWNTDTDALQAHLSKNYFQHVAFKHYPVCCISWQAANEYCKWLTLHKNASGRQPKILFRLPTENEWLLLAEKPDKDGLDTTYPNAFDIQTQHYQFNFSNNDSITHQAKDGGYFTVDVNAYWANKKGILNLQGNVAEMISDSTICKGGSWNDNLKDCSVYARKHYTLPNTAAGLRVFAVVR